MFYNDSRVAIFYDRGAMYCGLFYINHNLFGPESIDPQPYDLMNVQAVKECRFTVEITHLRYQYKNLRRK
jgi:hypothetical protein